MNISSENAIFEYLLANVKDTICTYYFFAAWEKVICDASQIEVVLNILNALSKAGVFLPCCVSPPVSVLAYGKYAPSLGERWALPDEKNPRP